MYNAKAYAAASATSRLAQASPRAKKSVWWVSAVWVTWA